MYSPTLFDPELHPIKNRGKENAVIVRGLVLDIEHSVISPEEFSVIFGDLQMICYSSFNHTDDRPRYRICIPTTHFVTPQTNEVICWTIADKLSKLGYGDKGSERPHGLDTGKFEGTRWGNGPAPVWLVMWPSLRVMVSLSGVRISLLQASSRDDHGAICRDRCVTGKCEHLRC